MAKYWLLPRPLVGRLLSSVFVLMFGGLNFACNHLFYQPDSRVYLDLAQYDISYTEGFIKTKDFESIHYWNIAPKGEELGTILHFHGNAQNMTAHALYTLWLTELGYRLIVFDYRGYGRSTGTPSPEGLFLDGQAVLDFVCQQKYKNLFIIGQSLGGIAALTLLTRGGPACTCGLVLESTFSSYRDIARDKVASTFILWPFQYPLSYLVSDDWSPKEACQELRLPTLVIHGDRDRVVPFKFGQELMTLLGSEQKELWQVKGQGHTAALVPGSPYRMQLLHYLQRQRQQCSKT